jgi:hypothetical protein
MGISPNIFGPYLWASIHLICLGAPKVLTEEQKKNYLDFFNKLPFVMPCTICGRHLFDNLSKYQPDVSSGSTSLFKWSVDLHNLVNSQLGKKQMKYEDAQALWTKIKTPFLITSSNSEIIIKNNYLLFVIGIMIGCLIMYLLHLIIRT